ncbi:MAG: hypothetical protein BGN88_03955 [Clostridiales bacterium 43-6]|nr:MAG: hypothetical protein BGN88_03955 [Clostridiales bacterium 43-6]
MIRINEKLNIQKNEAVLIENPVHVRYFTGIHSSAGFLFVTENNACFFIDFRYIEMAETILKNTEIKAVLQEDIFEQICGIIKKEAIKNVFIEADFQTVSAAKRIQDRLCCEVIADGVLDGKIRALREAKSKTEIETIKQAQQITDDTFSMLKNFIQEGVTEKELALEAEIFMRKNGAEDISFDLITISGENTSRPHGVPTDKKLRKGDFITMDMGCKVDGYCSDMTRTVALGFVSDEQNRVYETVLKAQKAALAVIKAGMSGKDVDDVARSIIYKAGYEGCFGHGLGHGVGIEIHESPSLSPKSKLILKKNMVVTVEPGIYLKGKFGVRIEDMVVVMPDGCINLTKSEKELIIL